MQESNQHNATQDECIWNTNYFTSRKYFCMKFNEILHSFRLKIFQQKSEFQKSYRNRTESCPTIITEISQLTANYTMLTVLILKWSRFNRISPFTISYHFTELFSRMRMRLPDFVSGGLIDEAFAVLLYCKSRSCQLCSYAHRITHHANAVRSVYSV